MASHEPNLTLTTAQLRAALAYAEEERADVVRLSVERRPKAGGDDPLSSPSPHKADDELYVVGYLIVEQGWADDQRVNKDGARFYGPVSRGIVNRNNERE